MTENADRRVQLREGLYKAVLRAAEARFTTPVAFITSLIVRELLSTGEMVVPPATPLPSSAPAPAPKPKLKPIRRWVADYKGASAEDHQARIDEIGEMFRRCMVTDDMWDIVMEEAEWHQEQLNHG